MILRHTGWNPDSVPCMKLTETDVQSTAEELVQFHSCFIQRRLSLAYISGLLSNKETKSIEPVALEFLDENSVRPLQQFLKSQRWDHEAMEMSHQTLLSQSISCPEGMLTVDIVFQSKPQIASALIDKIDKTNLFPAKWVGCDATFESDGEFLEALPKGKYYFAGIRSNAQVFLRRPTIGLPPYQEHGRRPSKRSVIKGKTYTVGEIAKSKKCIWSKVVLAEGAKGPILADVACLRVYPSRDGLPQKDSVWLFIRCASDGQMKYAFSNAPQDTPLSELCKAATMRWPIEQCFQDGKSQVGMDQYEHRSWPAWHRHMIHVFLALHFLLRLRIRFKKNSGTDATASSDTGCGSVTAQNSHNPICIGNYQIPYEEERCRLSLT